MKLPSTLYEKIELAIHSGTSGLWIRSHEPNEVLLTFEQLKKDYQIPDRGEESELVVMVWNRVQGIEQTAKHAVGGKESCFKAIEALMTLALEREARERALEQKGKKPDPAEEEADAKHILLVIRNGHLELFDGNGPNKELILLTQEVLNKGKRFRCVVVFLAYPGVNPPLELQESLWCIDHELPGRQTRLEIVQEVLDNYDEKFAPEKVELVADSTGGLTRLQVESVVANALSMKDGGLEPELIWTMKADAVNKSGLLTLHRGRNRFDSYQVEEEYKRQRITRTVPGLGGLEGLKEYSRMLFNPPESPIPLPNPKGLLLLGVPGTGKSQFAKALGNELKRASLVLDLGRLMGGIVGDTERNTRAALEIMDAMEPAVVLIEEIESALPKKNSSQGDSGVASRQAGSLLVWLNDHKSDVFVLATSNSIKDLHMAMFRSGRFNAKFFMDMPSRAQKDLIWDIYCETWGLAPSQEKPDDTGWTGADIEACCENALYVPGRRLINAAKYVIPESKTRREDIESLRTWAHGRCLDAETGELYAYRELRSTHPAAVASEPSVSASNGREVRAVRKRRRPTA